MGGVSIISGTLASASGTISDLKNNYTDCYFFYKIILIITDFVNINLWIFHFSHSSR